MTALQKAPFSVIRSGLYDEASGGVSGRDSHYGGNYWSSHTYSLTDARYLHSAALYFYPQNGGHNKPDGFTVRCVVR